MWYEYVINLGEVRSDFCIMMLFFEKESFRFQVRVGSVIIHNNKILLQRAIENKRWFLPGGRAEHFEDASKTIEREISEEYATPIIDKRLVWVVENFTTFPTSKLHEIALFYHITLPQNSPIYLHESEFIGNEEEFINLWVSLDQLNNYSVIPNFIVPELKMLDFAQGVKHIVNREERLN
jgi:8-oxo-dGTP pyrophosphatase MutT (NUDIX family)